MKNTYIIEYLDENEFRKRERALKKYNMLAYKKFVFEYCPKFREGSFLGELIATNSEQNTETYELKLPTDEMFVKVHGDIILHYMVYKNDNIVMLNTITPDSILDEGHRTELTTYKGVVVSKEHQDKDMFKINLLNMLQ